ncbi:hypothetical protein [Streptomyces sp. NPDC021212]|uniref:imine reductase family protein n=1 Tax=Streptomyces sp. NPDC021212 TaxID=3365118 RepID=UPI0037BAE1EE
MTGGSDGQDSWSAEYATDEEYETRGLPPEARAEIDAVVRGRKIPHSSRSLLGPHPGSGLLTGGSRRRLPGVHCPRPGRSRAWPSPAPHGRRTAKSVGIDTALPAAVRAHYHRAIEDGHGTDSWTRIIDGIRAPRAHA